MQLSLLAAFILLTNILWCGVSANDCNFTSILLNLGHSKECLDSILLTCLKDSSLTPEESSLKEDFMSKQENIMKTLMEVKALLQEAKSERENIANSFSEIKIFLQEVKRELENVKNKSPSRDYSIPGGTTANPEEMKPGKIIPKNCADLRGQLAGELSEAVQTVFPDGAFNSSGVVVYCDQVADGGGWTVIQSRLPLPIRENFTRTWNEYVEGFGDLKGEFWLGLDNIHALTNSAQMQLRVDLEDSEGQRRWAHYGTFHVGDAVSKYVLTIGDYSGDAGDGMNYPDNTNWNLNGTTFSTHDQDNDRYPRNCAERFKGGWWFNACHGAHLNGLPIVGEDSNRDGISWVPFRGWFHSMKKASMKIRPLFLRGSE